MHEKKNDELMHYGVLGQKWGVRRSRGSDGRVTSEAKAKYRTDRLAGNIGRAMTNTSVGQRLLGVGTNKGYRQDKKEIKGERKRLKESYKSIDDKQMRKAKNKTLKSDYKKTLGEARINAADALYEHQSLATNKKIQTQNAGKQFVKGVMMGGYGALNYDRLTANNTTNRGMAAVAGILSGMTDKALAQVGGPGIAIPDYIAGRLITKQKYKQK